MSASTSFGLDAMSEDYWSSLRLRLRKLDEQVSSTLEQWNSLGHQADQLDPQLAARQADTLAQECTVLLDKMKDAAEQMETHVHEELQPTKKAQKVQFLKRAQVILQEHKSSFNRIKSVVGSSLKRAELLDFSAKRRNSDEKEQSRNVDILLKEQSSLERSLRSTDAVLGQAFATHDDLRRQSGILAGARNKALQMLSTSPMINNLIVKIRRAKQKDMIVLAITIAICLTFTVIYWWNK